ncbi:MAG: DNA polymerase III subunit epsilon [Gemmobacter sp.]
MREIVLDTETTGLDPAEGHRIVEIGGVELMNHMPTGRNFHEYINPERPMPAEAFAIHGLGDDFLRDKPVFARVGQAFIDFIGDAKLVIHNASFDMRFLNAELRAIGLPILPQDRAIDTLMMARQKFPGAQNTLDALCRRFGIDNSVREKHGALLDSELLAEVYLELIGGRQPDFALAPAPVKPGPRQEARQPDEGWRPGPRPAPLPPRLTDDEAAAHAAFVERLGDGAIWKKRA